MGLDAVAVIFHNEEVHTGGVENADDDDGEEREAPEDAHENGTAEGGFGNWGAGAKWLISKAAGHCRTPGRYRGFPMPSNIRQVLECGSALPLWPDVHH